MADVFAAVAPQYDLMNDLMSAGLHRLWKDTLVSTLRPAPGQVHLDVAGGTGDVAFRVLAQLRRQERAARLAGRPEPEGGAGVVVVSDINPAMLREGRRRAHSAGHASLDSPLDEHGVPRCAARAADAEDEFERPCLRKGSDVPRHLPQHRLTRHTHPTLMHLFAPLLCSAVRVCLGRAEACV